MPLGRSRNRHTGQRLGLLLHRLRPWCCPANDDEGRDAIASRTRPPAVLPSNGVVVRQFQVCWDMSLGDQTLFEVLLHHAQHAPWRITACDTEQDGPSVLEPLFAAQLNLAEGAVLHL